MVAKRQRHCVVTNMRLRWQRIRNWRVRSRICSSAPTYIHTQVCMYVGTSQRITRYSLRKWNIQSMSSNVFRNTTFWYGALGGKFTIELSEQAADVGDRWWRRGGREGWWWGLVRTLNTWEGCERQRRYGVLPGWSHWYWCWWKEILRARVQCTSTPGRRKWHDSPILMYLGTFGALVAVPISILCPALWILVDSCMPTTNWTPFSTFCFTASPMEQTKERSGHRTNSTDKLLITLKSLPTPLSARVTK